MKPTGLRAPHVAVAVLGVLLIAGSCPVANAQTRPTAISVELEHLVNTVRPSGGQVVRQEMEGFGAGWSGAQLFWRAPAPVDAPIRNWPHLSFPFSVPADGTYEVTLRHTIAPDFATFRVFLDGQPVADVDGYSPSVAPRARSLGARRLATGSHSIVITVFSKSPASKGYAVGLDRLDVQPIAAGTAQRANEPSGAARTPPTTQPGPTPATPPPAPPPGGPSSAPSRAGQGAPTMTLPPSPTAPVVPAPKLWAAQCSGKSPAPDCRISRPVLVVDFGWESPLSDTLDWRWQVATEPFPASPAGMPSGLVGHEPIPKKGQASAKFFQVNFGTFPPLVGLTMASSSRQKVGTGPAIPGAQGGSPPGSTVGEPPCPPGGQQKVVIEGKTMPAMPCPKPGPPGSGQSSGASPESPITLYVRIVALQGGQPVGPPSNTVTVTYAPASLVQLVGLVGPSGAKVERDKLPLHFPWEDTYFRRKGPAVMLQGVYWRWQIASTSFAGTTSLKPAGLLADGALTGSEFSLSLSSYLDSPKALYVRVVPLANPYGGELAGAPSNEVVVDYVPYKPDELLPEAHFVSWQGPKGYEWNYRCWQIASRDVYGPNKDAQGKPIKIIAKGQQRNVCKKDDANILEDIADAAEAFVKALADLADWASGAYKSLKSSVVNAVAGLCGSQKDKCQVVAAVALDTGLAALGVPPDIPNFDQLVAQLKQGGVELLAAELVGAAGAENIPLAQDAAEAAITKVLDEVQKVATEGDPKAPVWVPDPAGLYRPAVLVVELRNPNFPVAVKVDAIRLTSTKMFGPMEIPLKGVTIAHGQTVRVPIFPTPTAAPDAWIKMLPAAPDRQACLNSLMAQPGGATTCKTALAGCTPACQLLIKKEQDAKHALESWQKQYGTTLSAGGVETMTVTVSAGAVKRPALALQCNMWLGGTCKPWSQWKQPAYP
jgi:hypothetical protein